MRKKVDKDSPTRICHTCGLDKPWSEFHRHSQGTNGYTSRCKNCVQKEVKGRHDADPLAWKENRKRINLETSYGISLEEFNLRVRKQNNLCGICREPMTLPHVDHNHETGKNRDLLCFRCNIGLGYFKDSPARLEAAINYLNRHEENPE